MLLNDWQAHCKHHDIEIMTATSLLKTDIYVYTKVGANYQWQRFSRSMLGEEQPESIEAIFLQNTAGVHYDVVLHVDSNVTMLSKTCLEYFQHVLQAIYLLLVGITVWKLRFL